MPKLFAYGIYMDMNIMAERVGTPLAAPRGATLPEAKLVFDVHNFRYASATANVLLKTGIKGFTPACQKLVKSADTVEGILYELSDEQFTRLDRFESSLIPNENTYRLCQVKVKDSDGLRVDAYCYIAYADLLRQGKTSERPTLAHLSHMLLARRYLSQAYFEKLLDLPLADVEGCARNHIVECFFHEKLTHIPEDAKLLSIQTGRILLPCNDTPEEGYVYKILTADTTGLKRYLTRLHAYLVPILGLEVEDTFI